MEDDEPRWDAGAADNGDGDYRFVLFDGDGAEDGLAGREGTFSMCTFWYVEALTRALVNKILHTPFTRLRQQAEREDGMACLEVARLLFGLDEREDSDADSRSGQSGRETPDDE